MKRMKRMTTKNTTEQTKRMTPQVLALSLYDIVSEFTSNINVLDDQKLSELVPELELLEKNIMDMIVLARKTNDIVKESAWHLFDPLI